MPELIIRTPIGEGAARVSLITPEGSRLTDLNTPIDNQMRVPDASFGEYRAIVEPLGGAARYFSFSFGPGTKTVELGSAADEVGTSSDTTSARELIWQSIESSRSADAPPPELISALRPAPAIVARADDPLFFLGLEPGDKPIRVARPSSPSFSGRDRLGYTRSASAASAKNSAPIDADIGVVDVNYVMSGGGNEDEAALAIGLSHDSKPFDPGGWKPFRYGNLDLRQDADGRTANLFFERHNVSLPDPESARLRLSAKVSGGRTYRMLVPLFDGGLRVQVHWRDEETTDLEFNVAPLDPDRLALSQALAAGSRSEGLTILEQFLSRNNLFSYISDDAPQDPWTAILAVLVGIRFGKLDQQEGEIVRDLMQRYRWISDSLILEARRLISEPATSGTAYGQNRKRALSSLTRARAVGAPYFYYSNAMVSDILAALASTPDEIPDVDASDPFSVAVANERSMWQRSILSQGQTGAFFIWRTQRRVRVARFDPRYVDQILPAESGS